MADVPAIEQTIFSDPSVAKGLAHDTSREGNRRQFAEDWCSDLGIDGSCSVWREGGLAGYAIFPIAGDPVDGSDFLGVVGFYGMERKEGLWTGEIFYALGSRYHGKGIMTEACQAVMTAYLTLPNSGDLYAVYWGLLNPASGKILRRLGFKGHGHKSLLAEYTEERVRSFGDFELWRLKVAKEDDIEEIAFEAATKLGHLCYEGLLTIKEANNLILDVLPSDKLRSSLLKDIEAGLERGARNPGLTLLYYAPR